MTHIDTSAEACERLAACYEAASQAEYSSRTAAMIRQLVRERDEARALSMPAPALNMEVCGKCMGTGTAGHPDSGYTCDCDGGMVAAPTQAWRDISTAPNLERVIVAGWQPATKDVAGYWWYEEDLTDNEGVPINCPTAKMWHPMPAPPAALMPDTEGGA